MSPIVSNGDGCQQSDHLTVDVQHKDIENEIQAETLKVEELNELHCVMT